MRSSPTLLLRLQRQQHPPRVHLPGLCFPKLPASRACVPRASQVVSQQVGSQPSASSGAPACPPSPRHTPLTAPTATPAGQPTVSFLLPTLPFFVIPLKFVHPSGAIITSTSLLENLFHEFIINPHPRSLGCIHCLFLRSTQFLPAPGQQQQGMHLRNVSNSEQCG